MSTPAQPTPFSGRGGPRRGNGGRVFRGSGGSQRNSHAASAPPTPSGRGGSPFQPRGRGRGAARGRGSTTKRGNASKPATPAPDIFEQLRNASVGNKRATTAAFANAGILPAQSDRQIRNPIRQTNATLQKKRDIPINDYNARYEQLKIDREEERAQAIATGQMTDPNERTLLSQAVTPVGACTEMCPEFERVERIVQKTVDKAEKLDDGQTLHDKENKMIKRFRRSAAGYDEQLPSDIRTPATLLQTMDYILRHIIGPDEHDLGSIHKFVWDRTRSIRNDLSVQLLTQAQDVKIAVKCLERIARFHILSLHLLSSPDNTEHFDHHQEREQLSNTLISLLYYYDDHRSHMQFPNEDEFRAYYIVLSISDPRPDLETRVQRWPQELRESPRIKAALDLFTAAGNTWEYQGTLNSKRQSPIAQNNYIRFFNLIKSEATSYLMACMAEIYFSQVRQTAVRSIWKAYCRQPVSQQSKNREWTITELTAALHFDDDQQTQEFCINQGLTLIPNDDGRLFLDWAQHPIDAIEFQPTAEQVFSYRYVEAKRCGRTTVALILGMSVAQALKYDMIDESLLQEDEEMEDREDGLFVEPSSEQSEKSPLYPSDHDPPVYLFSQLPPPLRPSSPSASSLPPSLSELQASNPFGLSNAPLKSTVEPSSSAWGAVGNTNAPFNLAPAPASGVPEKTPFSFSSTVQQSPKPSPFVWDNLENNKLAREEEKEKKEVEVTKQHEREVMEDAERQRVADEAAAAAAAAAKAEIERKKAEEMQRALALQQEQIRREAEEAEERRKEQERRSEKERQLKAELEAERRERARLEKEIRDAKIQERIRRQEEEERHATQVYIMKQKEAEHKAQLEKERRIRDIEREIEEEVGKQKTVNVRDEITTTPSFTTSSPKEPPLTMEELLGNELKRSTSSVPEKSSVLKKPIIDEDELILSAARLAAHKLAGGRQWLTDYTKTISRSASAGATPSLRSSFGYSTTFDHIRGASEGSRVSVNGYDVALAPEDTGLGRSLSRTEQRIRRTGAHGLASLPFGTLPKPREQTSRGNKRIKLNQGSV